MDRKAIINIILLLLIVKSLSSQELKVVDDITGNPIPNVVIVCDSEQMSVQTNSKGIANIDIFSSHSGNIKIVHAAYTNISTNYKEITEKNFEISLLPAIMQLEETVVSATRRAESKYNIPYNISTIRASEIERYQPQTSADLLEASGEVYVQKSQMGGGSPMIRGFGSNRVLLVIDGVRMNNAIFRHGNLHNIISLDANSIDNVEVIFGPGSVMYGSDAIGGVLSFTTKKPEFSSKGTTYNANFMTRASSANFEKSASADISISGENFASLTSLTFSDFDDLNAGRTNVPDSNYLRRHSVERWGDRDTIIRHTNRKIMHGTAYNYFNLMQKLRYKLSDNLELNYGFLYSKTSDIPRFDRLNIYQSENILRFAEWHYGPQTWLMNNLQATYRKQNTLFDEMNITLAHQNYNESRHQREYQDVLRYNRYESVSLFTGNFDFYKRIKSQHDINYGLEIAHNIVNSQANVKSIDNGLKEQTATRYPDGSTLTASAVYFAYRNHFSNRFTFSSGLRASLTNIHAEFDNKFHDFNFNEIKNNTFAPTASAGLIYRYNSKLNVSLNLSTGFRAPNIDDIAKVFDSEPGSVVVPNPNLNPEYIYNADFGVTKRIHERLNFQVNCFYSYLENIMLRNDFTYNGNDSIMYDGRMSRVQAIVNSDYAIIYGFNSSIDLKLSDMFTLKSSLTWMDGYDSNNDPMRHVTPLYGATHLIFTKKDFTFDLYSMYNGAITPENLSPEEHRKSHMYVRDYEYAKMQSKLPENEQFNPLGLYSPAWITLNLSMSYSINQNLQASVSLHNLTNELYRTYSSGIPSFGRNIIVSLRGSF